MVNPDVQVRDLDSIVDRIVGDINTLVAQLVSVNSGSLCTYAAIKMVLDRELPHVSRSLLFLDPDSHFWMNFFSLLSGY